MNEMMSEQQIVQADKMRANQIAEQKYQMMERQRQIMRDQNDQLINSRKNQKDLERQLELQNAGTTP
jgi:hypothetical protein